MPFLSGSKHLQQEDMQWMPGQPERKGWIEKQKQEQFKNSNWAASVKKNRNASRVVNSAQLSARQFFINHSCQCFLVYHEVRN